MNTLKPVLLAAAALGVTVLLIQPNPTFADTTRTPTTAAKLKSSGGPAHAQPGDTCLGVSACNTLIVECIESGHDFKPIQDSPSGEPYYGQCVKRTD
jgi:hypothetical protein